MDKERIHRIFLLIGSNQGDRNVLINSAKQQIEKKIGTICSVSSIYETEPWGFNENLFFLNQAIEVLTGLSPDNLMNEIIKIEEILGRIRVPGSYQSRTIDIDILFYDELVIETEYLTIPHPRIQERRFVLTPMAEIAANFLHPVFKKKLKELLVNCKDDSLVNLYLVTSSRMKKRE